MIIRTVLTLALTAISFNALADSAPDFIKGERHSASTLTRAAVLSDAADAQRKGWIPVGEAGTPMGAMQHDGAAKSRDQVRIELLEAQRMGHLRSGEAYSG